MFSYFLIFPAHAKNGPRWAQMGPGGFFPTNPDLADILGRTDLDFENFLGGDFFGSQISRFPGSKILDFPISKFLDVPIFKFLGAWLADARRFFTFLRRCGRSMALLGVRRGFKMILSHRAPSSLNMSSYRAIWTHFRPNFIFLGPKNLRLPKIQTFPKMPISSSSHSHKYLTYMGR